MDIKDETANKPQTSASVTIIRLILLMAAIQALREGLKAAINVLAAPSTPFEGKMVTMVTMILLSVLFVIFAKIRKVQLNVFPERFTKGYVIFTCIAAAVLIFEPAHFTQGFSAAALTFYGSVVTPVFEELIFRGYIWNRLDTAFKKPIYTFIATVLLFSVWHLGYIIPQTLAGNVMAVVGKLLAGFCYGIVTGFVRLKTRNCYSAMLVHGLINMFMI